MAQSEIRELLMITKKKEAIKVFRNKRKETKMSSKDWPTWLDSMVTARVISAENADKWKKINPFTRVRELE